MSGGMRVIGRLWWRQGKGWERRMLEEGGGRGESEFEWWGGAE